MIFERTHIIYIYYPLYRYSIYIQMIYLHIERFIYIYIFLIYPMFYPLQDGCKSFEFADTEKKPCASYKRLKPKQAS